MDDPFIQVLHRVIIRDLRKLIGLFLISNDGTGRNIAAFRYGYSHQNHAGFKNTSFPHKGFKYQSLHADEGIVHDDCRSMDLSLMGEGDMASHINGILHAIDIIQVFINGFPVKLCLKGVDHNSILNI